MMKTFTSMRKMLAVAALAMVSSSAFADSWYSYKVQAEVIPAGAGKIYVVHDDEIDPSTITEYSSEVELTGKINSSLGWNYYYFYTQPSEGYQFAGVAAGVKNEDGSYSPAVNEEGNVVLETSTKILTNYIKVEYKGESAETEEECADIPEEPDMHAYAVFCRVRPDFASGHNNAGNVTIDKANNDLGDVVTMTAHPLSWTVKTGEGEEAVETKYDAEFLYWTVDDKENGEQIKDNPLTVTVDGTHTYYAHFTAPDAIQMTGNEGWMFFHKPWTYLMADDAEAAVAYAFQPGNAKDEVEDGLRLSYIKEDANSYSMYGTVAYALNVTAPTLLVTKHNVPTSALILDPYAGSGWTGEDGLDLDVVEGAEDKMWYIADLEAKTFNINYQYVLPANSLYIGIPKSTFIEGEAVPEVIYWNKEAAKAEALATGISEAEFEKNVANGKIYNINGMEMINAGKGLFIMNGKKVVKK